MELVDSVKAAGDASYQNITWTVANTIDFGCKVMFKSHNF